MDCEREFGELIRLVLAGQQEAYSELYDKTVGDVYRTVSFLIDEKADVDDVVQDVYIQVYQSLSKFDPSRRFRPWLIGVTMKQIHAYRRKRWMRIRTTKKAERHESVIQVDFSSDVVEKVTNGDLVALVDGLSYKLKQVIILHYLHEYSQEEVASILHIPLGTVKSRIHAALKKLRQKEQSQHIFLKKVGKVQ